MSETNNYREFDSVIFARARTAVIDGDGFAYAIGWNHKDDFFEDKARKEVDDVIHDILQGTLSEHFVGILRPEHKFSIIDDPDNPGKELEVLESKPNFRAAVAISSPYKGTRAAKPEWYYQWRPIIEDQLITKWGFVRTPEGFEADDMVATLFTVIKAGEGIPICCGNDKDLRQLAGMHFNIRSKVVDAVTSEEAEVNLWKQVLMGDAVDGIPGIKGLGKVGAQKILLGTQDPYEHAVLQTYIDSCKGDVDSGIQCFYENYMLVKLRTDLSLEGFEDEPIHGYDIKAFEDYNKVDSSPEDNEDIPDFSA